VYFGFSLVDLPGEEIEPMVMSIGWNPQFENKEKSVEVHILKKFETDFYGKEIKIIAIGFIRHMAKFSGLDELIKAINNDVDIAKRELNKPEIAALKKDDFWKKN